MIESTTATNFSRKAIFLKFKAEETPVYKKEDSTKVKNNGLVNVLTIYSVKDLQMTDAKTNK